MTEQRFEGTKSYIATEDLKVAVMPPLMLSRPFSGEGRPALAKTSYWRMRFPRR